MSDSSDADVLCAAVKSMENHWHTLLAAHFEEEEQLIRAMEDELDPESVARISAEHAELRLLAAGPCTLEPGERLRRFGDLLRAHVRYEERTFFPQLQSHPRFAKAGKDYD